MTMAYQALGWLADALGWSADWGGSGRSSTRKGAAPCSRCGRTTGRGRSRPGVRGAGGRAIPRPSTRG
jgi:hypothetical protein